MSRSEVLGCPACGGDGLLPSGRTPEGVATWEVGDKGPCPECGVLLRVVESDCDDDEDDGLSTVHLSEVE